MPVHPLDWLLDWRRWRRFTAYCLCVVAFGALLMGFSMLDVDMLKAAFAGHKYTQEWEVLQNRMRPGLRLVGGAGAAAMFCLGMWAYSWYVAGQGGAYWFRRSREARRLLHKQGLTHPSDRQLCLTVMRLEEAGDGWRPETVLKFLEVSLADPGVAEDRPWLDRIRAWSVKLRVAADQSFLEPSAVHQLELSGVKYDSDTIATLSEKIDARLLDLRFKGTGTPPPVRRF